MNTGSGPGARWSIRLVQAPERSTASKVWLTAAALVVIGLFGLIDWATGRDLSADILYVPVIGLGTLAGGSIVGSVLAGASALATMLAEAADHQPPPAAVLIWNLGTALCIFAFVVALIVGLQRAVTEASRSEARTRQFFADAAHQLRTPLSAIRATSEAVLRIEGRASRERLLVNLADQCERVGQLVDRLLAAARSERAEMGTAAVDLVQLGQEQARLLRVAAPSLRIDVTATGPVPPVAGDANSLRDVLGNLLDNARRHARTRVILSVRAEGSSVIVSVSDDGAGLDPEAAALVFERFVSLDGMGGSGLGLAIARGVARAHGGDLVYREGRFEMLLPALVQHPARTDGVGRGATGVIAGRVPGG